MNTQENNKLIAEFMGAEKTHIQSVGDIYCPVPSKNGSEYEDKLQYQTSWDWLMPVVDRIETLSGKLPTHIGNIPNDEDWESNNFLSTNINATYKAVVEFINQYNKNQ